MATLGNTPRPAYVYDTETDTWVPIGVGAHTHDTLYVNQNIIDAKGDLIVGTADNSYDRLAAGNLGDTLVADSSASTGLRWQGTYAGGKNFLINGGMDIWQRGTSSSTQGVTTADRWFNVIGGTTTFSQDTSVPTNANVQYSHKWTTGASSSYGQFYQTLERDVVRPLRGLTMTFSFWVRHTGTAFTGVLNPDVVYSNSTDAYVSVSTTVTFTGATNITPTGTWTRYSATFTVPSDAVGLKVGVVPTQVQASGVVVYLAACQLEVGSVTTAFTRAGGTLAGELAACQRYYWRNTSISTTSGFMWLGVIANYYSTTRIDGYINYPVRMRTIPSSVDFASIGWIRFWGEGATAISAVTINTTATSDFGGILQFTTTSAATTNPHLAYYVLSNNAAGYIGLSAEL